MMLIQRLGKQRRDEKVEEENIWKRVERDECKTLTVIEEKG